MLQRVGPPPRRRQEGTLQVGPQQAAAAGAMGSTGLAQHSQGLPQGFHGAGHQGGADRLHPIAPEQLQQLLQSGQVGGGELGEGQAQAAVDLQVHPGGAQPVALPVDAGGPAAGEDWVEGGDAALPIDRHPPEPIVQIQLRRSVAAPVLALRLAAGAALRQPHLA